MHNSQNVLDLGYTLVSRHNIVNGYIMLIDTVNIVVISSCVMLRKCPKAVILYRIAEYSCRPGFRCEQNRKSICSEAMNIYPFLRQKTERIDTLLIPLMRFDFKSLKKNSFNVRIHSHKEQEEWKCQMYLIP